MNTTAADDKKVEGWLAGWMGRVADKIKSGIDAGDYKVEVKTTKGPIVNVTVQGAEGDLTMAKKVRPQLEKILKDAIEAEVKGYGGFKEKVTSANRGDDFVFICEILFP